MLIDFARAVASATDTASTFLIFLIITTINENKETVDPLETSGFGLSLDWTTGRGNNDYTMTVDFLLFILSSISKIKLRGQSHEIM